MKIFSRALFVSVFLLLMGCGDTQEAVEEVENPDPITVTQFETIDEELDDSVNVTLEDGSTESLPVEWSRSLDAIDTSKHGTFEIEGTLEGEEGIEAGDQEAVQSITVEAATVEEALAHSENTEHFHTMYEAFDHPDKEKARTLFIPDDEAIESLLDLLEMDLETLMEDDLFEPLMLDHMSETTISQNRLETDIPHAYTALNGRELIVEGEQGDPLIDSEHEWTRSVDLDTAFMHVIEGVILSDDALSESGSNIFDDTMGDRLFEIFQNEGLIGDALRGESFTVFMPTQETLIDYADENDLSLNEFVESDAFERLLTRHIVEGEYSRESLSTDAPTSLEAINGESIDITIRDEGLFAEDARIVDSEQIEQLGSILTIEDILENGE
ncbi:MAG: fasciclin domain-containing protein [Bacillota bacterium]